MGEWVSADTLKRVDMTTTTLKFYLRMFEKNPGFLPSVTSVASRGDGDDEFPTLSKSGGDVPVTFCRRRTASPAEICDFRSCGRNTPL